MYNIKGYRKKNNEEKEGGGGGGEGENVDACRLLSIIMEVREICKGRRPLPISYHHTPGKTMLLLATVLTNAWYEETKISFDRAVPSPVVEETEGNEGKREGSCLKRAWKETQKDTEDEVEMGKG